MVPPGVDTDVFSPGRRARPQAAGHSVCDPDELVIVFAGRIQPLKGPDVVVKARSAAGRRAPGPAVAGDHRRRRIGHRPAVGHRLDELAAQLGIDAAGGLPAAGARGRTGASSTGPPTWSRCPATTSRSGWSRWRRRPRARRSSRRPSAALTVAVADGVSGLLVAGHDPRPGPITSAGVVLDPALHARLSAAAPVHAARFSWEVTVDGLLRTYQRAVH